MFKIVKKKELDELKQNYNDVADIVYSYGLFHDSTHKLDSEEGFDSEFVEKKWDRFYKLDRSIRTYLREKTNNTELSANFYLYGITLPISFCIGYFILPLFI